MQPIVYSPLPDVFRGFLVPPVYLRFSSHLEKLSEQHALPLSGFFNAAANSKRAIRIKNPEGVGISLNDLQLRFLSLKEVEGPEPDELTHILSQAAHHQDGVFPPDYNIPMPDPAELTKDVRKIKNWTPWMDQYRWTFLRVLGVSELEFFSHPLAAIVVLSAESSDIVEEARSLFDTKAPTGPFAEPFMDANIPVHYVIAQWRQDPAHQQAAHDAFSKLSAKLRDRETISELRLPGLTEDRGHIQLYSATDPIFLSVSACVQDFVQKVSPSLDCQLVGPLVETTLLKLVQSVTQGRKKLGGTLSRWFSSSAKKKDAEKSIQNGIYVLNSPEAETRRLGDLYAMVHDWERALLYYRLCADDYKRAEMWAYHAACLEAIGICSYLLGQMKEVPQCFETAHAQYRDKRIHHCALRVALTYAEILKLRGDFKLSKEWLLKGIADCDTFTAALIHEQVAFSYLFQASRRKFAFHLSLAGYYYTQVEEREHALRSYRATAQVYEELHWEHIDDHINLHLARDAFALADIGLAVDHACKLFQDNQMPAPRQASAFREFLHILQAAYDKGIRLQHFPLPVIGPRIQILLEDFRADRSLPWRRLLELLPGSGLLRPQNSSPLNEPLHIALTLKNPLTIPLQLTALHLLCQHSSDQPPPYSPTPNSHPPPPDPASQSYLVEPVDLLLAPEEERRLTLVVVPIKEGELRLLGLGFLLGSLWARTAFPLTPALSTRIIGEMPHLSAAFLDLPERLVQGQVAPCTLRLKNHGRAPLKNVRLALSAPEFFVITSEREERSGVLWLTAQNSVLEASHHLDIPVLVRAARTGNYTNKFNFLFTYQPTVRSPLSDRYFRLTESLRVDPSLTLACTAVPSPADPARFVVQLAVHNQGPAPAKLWNLINFSPQWKVESLTEPRPVFTVAPTEAASLLFSVRRTDPATSPPAALTPVSADLPALPPLSLFHATRFLTRERQPARDRANEHPPLAAELGLQWTMGEQQGLLFIDPVFRFPDIQLELPSKKKFKEIPCRVRVVAPASVPYSGGLAIAPCTITITNTSSQALTFAFYALPPTDRAVPYLWLGLTQKLLPLAPAQQHQLDLQVAFPTEGTYNLDRFQLHVTGDGYDAVVRSSRQTLVQVLRPQ